MNNAFDKASLFFIPRWRNVLKPMGVKPLSSKGVLVLTRSGTIGTYLNSSGKYVNEPLANMPRYSNNGSCLELLVEGRSENTCKSADIYDFDLANATFNQVSDSPIDAIQGVQLIENIGTGVGYFCTMVGDKFVSGQNNLVSFMYKPLAAGDTRHLSVILAGNGSGEVRLNTVTNTWVDSSDQDIVAVIAPEAIPNSGGWYRAGVFVNATYTEASVRYRLYNPLAGSLVYDGDGVSGLHLQGHNITTDTELTSYIPKYDNDGATTVVRGQETLVVSDLLTDSLIRSGAGTVQIHYKMSGSSNDNFWRIRGASNDDMIAPSGQAVVFEKDGSTESTVAAVLASTGMNISNTVIAWADSNATIHANNSLIGSGAFTAAADLTEIRIQGISGKTFSLLKMAVWPFKIIDSAAMSISNL